MQIKKSCFLPFYLSLNHPIYTYLFQPHILYHRIHHILSIIWHQINYPLHFPWISNNIKPYLSPYLIVPCVTSSCIYLFAVQPMVIIRSIIFYQLYGTKLMTFQFSTCNTPIISTHYYFKIDPHQSAYKVITQYGHFYGTLFACFLHKKKQYLVEKWVYTKLNTFYLNYLWKKQCLFEITANWISFV